MKTAIMLLLATQLLSNSSNGQCSFSTTPPISVPIPVSNVFSSGDEGFSGDFQWEIADENLATTLAPGTKNLVTPIYYTESEADIVLQFEMGMISDAELTGFKIFAQTAGNSSIAICNDVFLTTVSPLAPTTYYLTVPSGHIPVKTPFKLMIAFDVIGTDRAGLVLDNFAASIPSMTGTLPVKFGWFRASKAGSLVNLQWRSEIEEKTKDYIIERSVDGKSFGNIGNLSARGQGMYSFTDNHPLRDGYYRIKAVDFDQKFNYSTIAKVKNKDAGSFTKAFWRQRDLLVVQHEQADASTYIQLISGEGKLIASSQLVPGSWETAFNVPYTGSGMIIIRMVSPAQNAEVSKLFRN
jgi:hypothetical protein